MFSIIIQAGGMSKRMGYDKALLDFLGEPLIVRVITRIKPLASEVLVTTNRPQDFEFLETPLVPDIIQNRGALGGLYTALNAARYDLVAILACDMPFINPKLVEAEKEFLEIMGADLVVPVTKNGMEPLHAVYRKEKCLKEVKEAIVAEKWRVDSWYHKVNFQPFSLEEIQKFDPLFLSFRNVNNPQELQEAIELAKQLDSEDQKNKTPISPD